MKGGSQGMNNLKDIAALSTKYAVIYSSTK